MNYASSWDITIGSDAGTKFYYDIGTPTLTCLINNEEKAFNSVMGETYLEYFSLNFYDRYGKYTPLMKSLSSFDIDNKGIEIEVKVLENEKKKSDNKELYHQLDKN